VSHRVNKRLLKRKVHRKDIFLAKTTTFKNGHYEVAHALARKQRARDSH